MTLLATHEFTCRSIGHGWDSATQSLVIVAVVLVQVGSWIPKELVEVFSLIVLSLLLLLLRGYLVTIEVVSIHVAVEATVVSSTAIVGRLSLLLGTSTISVPTVAIPASLVRIRVAIGVAVLEGPIRIVFAIFVVKLLLLDKHSVELNIAVVHHQVLLHEAFETLPINNIKCAVLPETSH